MKNLIYREPVKVLCETTGQIFPSMSAAARETDSSMTTMIFKMQKFGFFMDKRGRKYVRLKPLKSKRIYCTGGTPYAHQYNKGEREFTKKELLKTTHVLKRVEGLIKKAIFMPGLTYGIATTLKEALNELNTVTQEKQCL